MEEEVNKSLQRHEKDHILGPFIGLSPEYMEMSESTHKTHTHKHTRRAALLWFDWSVQVIERFFNLEFWALHS